LDTAMKRKTKGKQYSSVIEVAGKREDGEPIVEKIACFGDTRGRKSPDATGCCRTRKGT